MLSYHMLMKKKIVKNINFVVNIVKNINFLEKCQILVNSVIGIHIFSRFKSQATIIFRSQKIEFPLWYNILEQAGPPVLHYREKINVVIITKKKQVLANMLACTRTHTGTKIVNRHTPKQQIANKILKEFSKQQKVKGINIIRNSIRNLKEGKGRLYAGWLDTVYVKKVQLDLKELITLRTNIPQGSSGGAT